ncbi:hypothetical protein AbraIFM66951_004701 [Aspergillus brasiliensis]|uniref:Uncharacterized protein n=1 Tax=Aspergillus brasiliensis TaxID=319629 RepID=A0A9W5YKX7_9EURO|nr:hypothetical protein AbraCBS73388_008324 [Aspergillus brasiliensis]GKZ43457.1 hypothetical protein AbraIFM66951_004701 [Aspergillus brasiliensis]
MAQWPVIENGSSNSNFTQVMHFMTHCETVIQLVRTHPEKKAKAAWVESFAQQALRLVTLLADKVLTWQPLTVKPENTSETSSSMTPGARQVLRWMQAIPDSAAPTPQSLSSSAPASHAQDKYMIPVREGIQSLLNQCSTAVSSVRITSAKVLRGGDVNLFTRTAAERERLVYNATAWLPLLPNSDRARIRVIDRQYAILANSVPTTFLPSPEAAEQLKEDLQLDDPSIAAQNVNRKEAEEAKKAELEKMEAAGADPPGRCPKCGEDHWLSKCPYPKEYKPEKAKRKRDDFTEGPTIPLPPNKQDRKKTKTDLPDVTQTVAGTTIEWRQPGAVTDNNSNTGTLSRLPPTRQTTAEIREGYDAMDAETYGDGTWCVLRIPPQPPAIGLAQIVPMAKSMIQIINPNDHRVPIKAEPRGKRLWLIQLHDKSMAEALIGRVGRILVKGMEYRILVDRYFTKHRGRGVLQTMNL